MRRFDTLAVHAGDAPDPTSGALEPPVCLSSAFAFDDAQDAATRFSEGHGNIYSRWRNPTVSALEEKLAVLEGAEDAVALASGMAAVHASLVSHLSADDHVVAAQGLYAESTRLLRGPLARFGVEVSFVDATDTEALAASVRPNTRVAFLETPANPTLAITDLQAARTALGTDITIIVDSTFATPYHQRPLEHGADLVVHSATKSLCGHGDAIGGVVAGSAGRVAEARKLGVRTAGAALSPLSAMLIARGIRTLGLRMQRASSSALELATRLEAHPAIERVRYPGLASHPGHDVARHQMTGGFGTLIAFELKGGLERARLAYDHVELITRAVSLGDVRSLLTHAASTTHASLSAEERQAAGIGEGMMRLSVGIEAVEDLWADLEAALALT